MHGCFTDQEAPLEFHCTRDNDYKDLSRYYIQKQEPVQWLEFSSLWRPPTNLLVPLHSHGILQPPTREHLSRPREHVHREAGQTPAGSSSDAKDADGTKLWKELNKLLNVVAHIYLRQTGDSTCRSFSLCLPRWCFVFGRKGNICCFVVFLSC